VVADSAGLYELSGLPVGAYRLTVALAGFVTAIRTDTFVLAPQRTRVDFTLCAAALEHIDWVVPPDLAALWARADVVAKFKFPPLAGVIGAVIGRCECGFRTAVRRSLPCDWRARQLCSCP
jgi:Carboxypeptidase regulatory-like domain